MLPTFFVERLKGQLENRRKTNSLRVLPTIHLPHDFASNDYLGLAQSRDLEKLIQDEYSLIESKNRQGSTGSRLISGNSNYCEKLEHHIAAVHNAEAALVYSSGYMANVGVLSALAHKGDTLLYDELSHACIKDGARLSFAHRHSFRHNDLEDLALKLSRAQGQVFVMVESIYSMDGDQAPLPALCKLCHLHNAVLIVDEAHTTGNVGLNGSGLVCALGLSDQVPIRIHTYGKAMGAHGAAVVCNQTVKQYLINFSRPFIYTTAVGLHTLVTLRESYRYVATNQHLQETLNKRIQLFRNCMGENRSDVIFSPIYAIHIPGNKNVKEVARKLQSKGYDVRPILSPTVKEGTERLRICIHAYNSVEEITELAELLRKQLQ